MLRIEDIDSNILEINNSDTEKIKGGMWLCMWPDDPTGTYYPPSVGSGNWVEGGYWHSFDYTYGTWNNTWSPCYPVGDLVV